MGQKTKPPAGATAKGQGAKNATDLHKARIERYSKAKKRSSEMARFLEEVEPKRAFKVGRCASWLLFHHYFEIDQYRLVKAYFCKQHLLCAPCAIRRSGKLLAQFLPKYEHALKQNPALRTYHVVLTVKNGPDLVERFNHLRSGLKTLNMRRRNTKRGKGNKSEWSKVLGAVGSYEITFNSDTKEWHPHLHLIVVTELPFKQYNLAGEWLGITGDSHQVRGKTTGQKNDPVRDFQEVFKYSLKFSELELYQNYVAFDELRGKQLFMSTGIFRGMKVPEKLTDDTIEEKKYIELMYRYYENYGAYSLVDKKKKVVKKKSALSDRRG